MDLQRGIASNTPECFSTFIGCKIVGVMFDAMPLGDEELSRGTTTIVFDDGRGLTLTSSGSYWVETPRKVQEAVTVKVEKLSQVKKELEGVLALAGAKVS